LVWAGLVVLAAGLLGLQITRGIKFETGLLALLPGSTQATNPLVTQAIEKMAEAGSKRVVLLVGHAELEKAGLAADAAAKALENQKGIQHVLAKIDGDMAAKATEFYLPWRYRILTPSQRQKLMLATDKALLDEALQNLYSPMGPPRLAPLESDPFGLFSEALLEAASRNSLRTSSGRLILQEGGTAWVVVLVDLADTSVSLGDQRQLLASFEAATKASRKAGATEVLRAGFVFHAAEAAAQAQKEMSTIGLGSVVGIIALMFLVFRSLRPILLTLLPILIGCVMAFSLSQLIFERLHLLTLVFGSSIIGVAVDYGLLFLSGRAALRPWDAGKRRRQILPSIAMAVGTSLLAYAALAVMPFPILRQMGVFTMLGLISAWLTALLWLPLLGAKLPPVSKRLPKALAWAKKRWPRVATHKRLVTSLGILALLSLGGLARLKSNDDVRQLYASAPETVRQQEKVQQLMRLPATGQFFLVIAPDPQRLLEREEALTADLNSAKTEGLLASYQCASQFVPSLKQQDLDQSLQFLRLYKPGGLVSKLFLKLESPETAQLARKQAGAKAPALLPETWLASPLSTPFRTLWLGKNSQGWASLVSLNGLNGSAALARLVEIGKRHDGVEFVDHLASLSSLMKRFRLNISWLLLLGYGVVSSLLWLRYKSQAWRVLLPTLLACLFTGGLFGWLGLNSNLFFVFGILLSLDMGVDYGIYMQEKGSGDFSVSLLSASLAALATLLSFGLLALSQTPALKIFGLTVLLGIGGSWLLAPCFSKDKNS
jgi:predicted exporter